MQVGHKLLIWFVILSFMIGGIFGCANDDDDDDSNGSSGNDDDDSSDDDNDDDDSSGDDDDNTPIKVISEVLTLDTAAAPANPVTGAETPDELNKIIIIRYRQDTGDEPPRPVKSILLFAMGWGAGATQMTLMAEDLIQKTGGDIEVWAIDRKTNLLEDTWGMDKAEAAKDPQIAYDYYYAGLPIDGKTFDGWYDPMSPDLDMMSEWGVDEFFEAMRLIIEQIPEENRQTNVFIGGHSQGARTARMFAAYEFPDGTLGTDLIAGLIQWDSADHQGDETYTEEEYLDILDDLRVGTLPRFYGQDYYSEEASTVFLMQYFAMAATEGFGNGDPRFGPDGFLQEWPGFIGFVKPFLLRLRNVNLTNEAFVGYLVDNDSGFIREFTGHLGSLGGGTLGQDRFGVYPNENGATYYWKHYKDTDPQELVDIQRVIRMIYEGPSNFTDTYNSFRFLIEHFMAQEVESEGTWVHNYFHYYTSKIDVPIFCLEGQFVEGTGAYEHLRDSVAPVRGFDLPREELGFEIFQVHDWSHLEVILVEPDRNPAYNALLNWLDNWSSGEVQVPLFGDVVLPHS